METDRQKSVLGVASVIGAALFFSLNTPLARLAYDGGSTPQTVVFIRVVLCVIGISLFALLSGRRLALPRPAVLPVIGVAVFIVLQGMCYLSSIAYIPVGLAALLFYTFPVMVAVASRLVDGGVLGKPRIIGFTAAFMGVALAIGPSFDVLDWRGIALALAAAFFNMFVFLFSSRALRHTSSVAVALYGNLGSVPLLGLGLIIFGGFQLPESDIGWAGLGGVAVFYTLAMVLHFTAIGMIGKTRSALMYNLEPLASIGAAAVLLGEVLEPLQYLGGAIIIMALVLSDWWAGRRSIQKETDR
ncbi:MAG: DMT family transporter [Rhodospirillaceae bacterium]|nr:DMT family transporter [Rhodospirillaceae bacterium]